MSKETSFFVKTFLFVLTLLKILSVCITPFVFLIYGFKYGLAHLIFTFLFILTTHIDNGKKD